MGGEMHMLLSVGMPHCLKQRSWLFGAFACYTTIAKLAIVHVFVWTLTPKPTLHNGNCIVTVVRRAYIRASYKRDLVNTPDGGTVSLDWWSGKLDGHMQAASPDFLCLHAFAGKAVF